MADDPNPIRHNLTAYVCCTHYGMVLGLQCPLPGGGTES